MWDNILEYSDNCIWELYNFSRRGWDPGDLRLLSGLLDTIQFFLLELLSMNKQSLMKVTPNQRDDDGKENTRANLSAVMDILAWKHDITRYHQHYYYWQFWNTTSLNRKLWIKFLICFQNMEFDFCPTYIWSIIQNLNKTCEP